MPRPLVTLLVLLAPWALAGLPDVSALNWPGPTQPEVWLKADSLSLPEGEQVFIWPDSSGHGRHATHSPGVPRFHRDVINGYPVLRFADNMLKIPHFGEFKSLFIVYKLNRTGHWSEQGILWNPVSNSDSTFAGGVIAGRFELVNVGFPGARRSDVYHPTVGQGFDLVSSVADPAVTRVYIDRNIQQNLSVSTLPGSTANNLILGIRSDGLGAASHIGTFGHFDIAELLLYRQALSESERQQVENYLHHKYRGPHGPTFDERARAAQPGDILNLSSLIYGALPHVPATITPASERPQLVFSDMPEYFRTGDGIALREEVGPGLVRLYTYHVPTAAAGPKVITSVLENLGGGPLNLRFHRHAFPTPSGHYLLVGKQGLRQFFTGTALPEPRTIPAGGILPIDEAMDAQSAWDPQLVHGFYEFEIDQPARVTVLQRPPSMTNATALATLPRLPRVLPGHAASGAGRGVFPDSNLEVTSEPGTRIDTADGPRRLVIADGNRDPWVMGWDSIDEVHAPNRGNYGVVYRIRLRRASSDGRGLAILMHNLYPANAFCRHQSGAVMVSRGMHPAGLVMIPRAQVTFSEAGDNVLLQVLPPLEYGREETLEILYSPPGASCLPTPILFLPIDFPRSEAATFDAWRYRSGFTPGELHDPAITGWKADPGGHGIPNALRYAFALDPRRPAREGLPSVEVRPFTVNGQTRHHLTLTHRRRQTQWDIEYTVEISADLVTWEAADLVLVNTAPAGDGVEQVTLRGSEPAHEHGPRFLRLRVERGG